MSKNQRPVSGFRLDQATLDALDSLARFHHLSGRTAAIAFLTHQATRQEAKDWPAAWATAQSSQRKA